MTKRFSASFIAASLLMLGACGADQQSVTETIAPADSVAPSGNSVQPDTAPTDKMATLSLIGGTPFSLVDTYRAKPVALWFWAPG